MKIRDLFILVIKLFGLYSAVIAVFTVFPQQVPFLIVGGFGAEGTIYVIVTLVLTVAIFMLLILNAHRLVDTLDLDKKFSSDEVNLGNVSEDVIIKISCIFLGGFTIIHYLPNLIGQTLTVIRPDSYYIQQDSDNTFAWITSMIQVAIGFYLVFNYQQIEKFLTKKEKALEE